MNARGYTVSQVARMANVTVRTLHHYDDIGLLTPSHRTESGYRVYRYGDLERLHQILLLRELDFTLEAIGQLLDDPAFERVQALEAQRALLAERMRRTEAILRSVDETIEAMKEGREMDETRLFEGFEGFDHARYEDEAKERWGDTEAYKTSMRRTRDYTKDDWKRIKAEAEGIMADLAGLMKSGADPRSAEALELAEAHRAHIERWFYPCSQAMHAGLADMYEADSRFGEHFETWGEGFTAFVATAFRANAAERRE